MVLIRALCVLLAVAGCNQSLFDSHGDRRDGGPPGDDGGPDGDGGIPVTCPAPCLADAAANFDEDPSPWRYLEEGPSHAWFAMDYDGTTRTGRINGDNKMVRCTPASSEPACRSLPDALLVTPAGASAAFFPALEYTSPDAKVVHLIVHASVPGDGAEQDIRLYRNGREDLLLTFRVRNARDAREIIVDALPNDRFLVSVEPTGPEGGKAAIHFFVGERPETFPRFCQFAASFDAASGNVVPNRCGAGRGLTSMNDTGEIAPMLLGTERPFQEQNLYADILPGSFFQAAGPPLDRTSGALTTQFWARINNAPPLGENAPAADDFNLDFGGGATIGFTNGMTPMLEILGDSEAGMGVTVVDRRVLFGRNVWRFVRIIEEPPTIRICVYGQQSDGLTIATDNFPSDQTLHVPTSPGPRRSTARSTICASSRARCPAPEGALLLLEVRHQPVVGGGHAHRQLGGGLLLLRAPGVHVRVVLAHQLAIGRLDLREVRAGLQVQDLVPLGDLRLGAAGPRGAAALRGR
jgi:hypothetical protein